MPKFAVNAVTPEGKKVKIVEESTSADILSERLASEGFIIVSISPFTEKQRIKLKLIPKKKVNMKDLRILIHQLSTLISA